MEIRFSLFEQGELFKFHAPHEIQIFHDIISNVEADEIQNVSLPQIRRNYIGKRNSKYYNSNCLLNEFLAVNEPKLNIVLRTIIIQA